MDCQCGSKGGGRWMRRTISPALRRRLVGFLRAASIALSRARRRPTYMSLSARKTSALAVGLWTYVPQDPSPLHFPVSLS